MNSPYEEKLNIINKFVDINSPSKMYDDHDIKGTYSREDDFISGTILELIEYFKSNFNPPNKNYESWKVGERYLTVPIDEKYLQNIVMENNGVGLVFFFEKTDDSIMQLSKQPIRIITK